MPHHVPKCSVIEPEVSLGSAGSHCSILTENSYLQDKLLVKTGMNLCLNLIGTEVNKLS